jgi:hypothetical protein
MRDERQPPRFEKDQYIGAWTAPARLQTLPREQWQNPIDHRERLSGEESWTRGAVEVRCGWQQCEGRLGQVNLTLMQGLAQFPTFFYYAPRGFVRVKDRVFAMGSRAGKQLRRGRPLVGRAPHGRAEDWDHLRPLGHLENPAPYETMGAGVRFYAHCLKCPVERVFWFTAEDAQRHLDCHSAP